MVENVEGRKNSGNQFYASFSSVDPSCLRVSATCHNYRSVHFLFFHYFFQLFNIRDADCPSRRQTPHKHFLFFGSLHQETAGVLCLLSLNQLIASKLHQNLSLALFYVGWLNRFNFFTRLTRLAQNLITPIVNVVVKSYLKPLNFTLQKTNNL